MRDSQRKEVQIENSLVLELIKVTSRRKVKTVAVAFRAREHRTNFLQSLETTTSKLTI